MRSPDLWRAMLLPMVMAFAACDSTPGPVDMANRPPVLSSFSYDPAAVSLDDLSPDDIVDGSARITVSVDFVAEDPEGDLAQVGFVVQSPAAGTAPLAAVAFDLTGNGRYSGSTRVSIPTAEVGVYTVRAFAVDGEGQLSNQVRGTLTFVAGGSPPVVENVDAPETVQIPGAGQLATFSVVAEVSDPDGQANVNRVFLRNASGSEFDMCDDGGNQACGGFSDSGDQTAGDGRYTVTFQIGDNTPEGPTSFDVLATDRSGLVSDPVTITIRFVR